MLHPSFAGVHSCFQLETRKFVHYPKGKDRGTRVGLGDGWMNGVLGHFYALSRLNLAGDNLG